MIRKYDGDRPYFVLDTENTTYAFCVTPSGHLEHIYYGARVTVKDAIALDNMRQRREFEPGNVIAYSKDYPLEIQEDMALEVSAAGHGDIREPFVALIKANGSRSADFRFSSAETADSAPESALPRSFSESGSYERLIVTLRNGNIALELSYCVYAECDVITRSARIINEGEENIQITRLMSLQLDLPESGLSVTSFHGAWAREMDKSTVALRAGKFVNESRAGCSSSRANPFFIVHDENASEDAGRCIGFNLIYSGSHYSSAEVSAFHRTRIVSGMQPEGALFLLGAGEALEAPEAVMTFTDRGFDGSSFNMHRFVKEHIIRGSWAKKPRPVLLNSWEACYFNISEQSLTSLARGAKDLGIELFVMDDGWFAERNDDRHSLGDWYPSKKKLPHGISGLSDKIRGTGMKFGLWVEPEMISTDSELYRAHPDWAMAVPGELHSEGRNQRIIDLCNPEVVAYLTEKLSEVFSEGEISYVKWDMNRIFSDMYSPYLPPERQGEAGYRYILGLYRLMGALTEKFPDILFEGCASGGNRFDLGILCYFPQIWASDNTDAICRLHIQEGYSYGYPQCCIGAHVAASPNHQTLRVTPLETRFNAAAFGCLGYECDVRDLSSAERERVTEQIALYKKWRDVLQYGRLYRIRTGNMHQWLCVSQDRKKAVGLLAQELTTANMQYELFRARGLDPALTYRFYSSSLRLDVKQFGSLINTVAPVHVRQDSLVHNVIAKAVKMNGETEDCTVSGDILMNSGIILRPAFSGTGFNDNVRVFGDFASRLYFIEEVKE